MEMIHGINSWERRVTCVIHPEAEGLIDSPKFGGIRTEQGPAGYVLQSGERFHVDAEGWAHQVIVNPSAIAIAIVKS